MNRDITFGSIVKDRRHYLGLTQAELARRANCAAITIRKIEANAMNPSLQIVELLAVALNIPAEERLAFVRLGRTEPEPVPIPTPKPIPDEIGQQDLTGRAIKGFELGERIAVGGFGAVYRALQPLVEREVAIKIILPQYADHPDFIRRFEAEAQLVARLEHPYIVPLYDYWREPSVAYLVMRLMRGGSLQAKLKDNPLTFEATLRIMQQIGDALHSAHRAGVIHRDLKPANILLDDDNNAYLADFGFAKNLGKANLTQHTEAGAVIGSLAYISPEQIQTEPVKPQSDIYCLGIVFYEMLTGRQPFQGPTPLDFIQQHLNQALPALNDHLPKATMDHDQVVALDTIIARATAKNLAERYPDVMALLADIEQLPQFLTATALHNRLSPGKAGQSSLIGRHQSDLDNPFKGLRAFNESDTADFFGRDTLIQELLGRLSEANELARFLAVVGPSGSGKSSVVKAGLIPALRRGGLPGSDNWFIIEMVPGSHPLEELEAALLRVAVNPPDTLLAQLREDTRGLLRAVRRILPANEGQQEQTELALIIDQFEEVFTQCEDENIRVHFLDSLVTAILDPRSRLRVVITLRADFIDRPLQYVDFGELIRRRTEFVLPLTPDELKEVITKPTARVGLNQEPGLAAAIIRDLGDQPGTLPLLQYTLTELFERRVGNALTLGAYQSSGGVRGALASRADELYTTLDEAGQMAARQLFLRLITLGEVSSDGLSAPDTRRRVLQSELASLAADGKHVEKQRSRGDGEKLTIQNPPSPGRTVPSKSKIQSVIELFGRHRLLTLDRDPVTRGPTVEVAHEALIREWDRLREWLDKDREFLFWQQRLRAGLHQWEASQYDEGALLRGAPLAEAENWLIQRRTNLNEAEREFIQAGLALRERRAAEREAQLRRELEATQKLAETEKKRAKEQSQAASSLRKRAVWLAGVGLVALLLAVAAGMFGVQSQQNADQAIQAQQNAEAEKQQAEAAQVESEIARTEAEHETRRARASQLATQAQIVLESDEDPSGTLALLLAREAVLTTLTKDGYFTPEADVALRQVVDRVPVLLRTFSGHTSHVEAAVFSPDGKIIATASSDQTIRLWDVSTGQEIRRIEGHTGAVFDVDFSPDGKTIASVSTDSTARLWDVMTAAEIHRFEGHSSDLIGVAFSPDGKMIATAGGRRGGIGEDSDNTIRLWNVSTGKEIRRLEGHTGYLTGLDFSPDGKTIVSASADTSARLWNVVNAEEIQRFEGHENGVMSAVFSPSGEHIITAGSDHTVRLWDVTSAEEIQRFEGHTDRVWSASFNPDGKMLLTAGWDLTARLWDLASGEEIHRLSGHTSGLTWSGFSPDGQMIATTSEMPDNTARLWAVNPKGDTRRLDGHRNLVRGAAFSPDGQTIATASDDKTIRLWDAATGQESAQLKGHTGRVNTVAFSPNGQILASAGFDKVIRLWSVATGQEIKQIEGHNSTILALAFSPNGQSIVTTGEDKMARLWDVKTGREIQPFAGHTASVNTIAFNPDGQTIVTGSTDKTLRLWDVATGAKIRTFEGHTLFVLAADFSPDGQTIVSAGVDNTVRLWNVDSGAEIGQFEGHEATVNAAVFSPEGASIVTTSDDGSVLVWDVETRSVIRRLDGHTDKVFSAAFSPDGQTIVTASADKSARLWSSVEQLLAEAEALIQRDVPEFTPEERTRFGIGGE